MKSNLIIINHFIFTQLSIKSRQNLTTVDQKMRQWPIDIRQKHGHKMNFDLIERYDHYTCKLGLDSLFKQFEQ